MSVFEIGTSGIEQLIARVTVLLAATLILDIGIRRWTSAAVRHLLWTAAVVGALAMPVLQVSLPEIGVVVRTDVVEDKPDSPSVVLSAAKDPLESRSLAPFSTTTSSTPRPSLPSRTDILSTLYLLGVGIVLGRILLDHALARRLLARCEPLEDGPWAAALHSLEPRVRVLRTSEDVPPLTIGVAHAAIVVPEAESWTRERRKAVLLHELAHVERRDCLTQLIAAIACALYWPHPLIWVAAARMRIERELACDDMVITRGVAPHRYAEHLLEIARGLVPTRIPVVAVSMAAPSHLEGRLRAVIAEGRSRFTPGRRTIAFAAGTALALFVPLSNVTGTTRIIHVAAPVWRLLGTATAPTEALVERRAPVARPLPSTPVAPVITAAPPLTRSRSQFGSFGLALTDQRASDGSAMVHLALLRPGSGLMATDYALSRFEGLTESQLRAPAGELSFRLREEAGTFEFTGKMNVTQGNGRFAFRPDSGYRAALAHRGIFFGEDAQFALTLFPPANGLVEELLALDYAPPTLAELVNAANMRFDGERRVDVDMLREYKALGYSPGTLGTVLGLLAAGLTPQRIRETGVQIKDVSLYDLRNRRLAGVAGSRPRPIPIIPGDRLAPEPATMPTTLDGTWTVKPAANGALRLDIDWSDVNEWNRNIEAFELRPTPTGFTYHADAGDFSFTGEISNRSGQGRFVFAPNRDFIARLAELGIREPISTHDLKNLGFYGMNAATIRELRGLGVGPIAKDELMSLAIFSVTPDFVRQVIGAGERDLSPENLVGIRMTGRRRP